MADETARLRDILTMAADAISIHRRHRDELPMWVVYRPTTREYPGRWVARMHTTIPSPFPSAYVLTSATLEGLREKLPPDLVSIGRSPNDVPEIEEVWL